MLPSRSMQTSSERLFRRRSWVVLPFLPLLMVSFPHEEIIERVAGDTVEGAFELKIHASLATNGAAEPGRPQDDKRRRPKTGPGNTCKTCYGSALA